MSERAAELRRAFDSSFARLPDVQRASGENLLGVTVGSDPYLVRLTEIAGVFVDKKITAVPSAVPAFLGFAGLRGTVVPVYDFGMLLGYPASQMPRWLMVSSDGAVGLAFEAFQQCVTVPFEAITAGAYSGAQERYVREVVRLGDVVRPVVSLTAVVEWIRKASGDYKQRSDR